MWRFTGLIFEFLLGLVLNICGCALGIWRAEMDHGAIQAEVDQRLLKHGQMSTHLYHNLTLQKFRTELSKKLQLTKN